MAGRKLAPRVVTIGAAQLGPIARDETRKSCVDRMLALLRQARQAHVDALAQLAGVDPARTGDVQRLQGWLGPRDKVRLGEYLDNGEVALLVVGDWQLDKAIDKAFSRAVKKIDREVKSLERKQLEDELRQSDRKSVV